MKLLSRLRSYFKKELPSPRSFGHPEPDRSPSTQNPLLHSYQKRMEDYSLYKIRRCVLDSQEEKPKMIMNDIDTQKTHMLNYYNDMQFRNFQQHSINQAVLMQAIAMSQFNR